MLIYQDYAKELLAKTGRLSELIKHSSSIGVYLEHLIGNFLKNFLGNRFSIKTGFIKNPLNGSTSNQIDIMIIDENIPSPYLFKDDNFVVAFPDSVVCAMEIKQRFDKETFTDIAEKAFQFQNICKASYIAFCYENTIHNDDTLYNWYKTISIPDEYSNYPFTIYVLDSYIIQSFHENFCKPGGHYFLKTTNVVDDKTEFLLTYFLVSIVKACEAKIRNLDNNTIYKFFGQEFDKFFEIKHYCMRYGIGMERPIKIFNILVGV